MVELTQRLKVTYVVRKTNVLDDKSALAWEQRTEEFVSHGMMYNSFFLGIRLSGEDYGDHPSFTLLPIGSIVRVDIEGTKGSGGSEGQDSFDKLFGMGL